MKGHICGRRLFRWPATRGMLRLFVLLLLLAPTIAATPSSALNAPQPTWTTYNDARFGFSIEYPAGWYVYPRTDTPGWYGETLSFSDLPAPKEVSKGGTGTEQRTVVTVGFYLAEIEPNQPLSAWTDLYESQARASGPSPVEVSEHKEMSTTQWKGLSVRGKSLLGPFQFTNIPNGRVVWFVWSNADTHDLGSYQHMVSSLKFADTSPRTLRAAYGETFVPQAQDASEPSLPQAVSSEPQAACGVSVLLTDPPGFRLPFTGQYTITTAPGCYDTHQGNACEAIDYGLPRYTDVKAAYDGHVTFMGWNNYGGGNVLDILHPGSYSSHYAHLDHYDVWYAGQEVYRSQVVAASGISGGVPAHLHFEVRNSMTGVAVWIRTLPTTWWRSGDPLKPCLGYDINDHGYAVGP